MQGVNNWNRFKVAWDRIGRDEKARFKDADAFYNAMVMEGARPNQIDAYGRPLNFKSFLSQIVQEKAFIDSGRPYYKVYPGYASMLSKTSLDIPAAVVRTPYPIFEISLRGGTGMFKFPHGGRELEIKSLMVAYLTPDQISLVIHRIPGADLRETRFISVFIDDGEDECSVLTMKIREDESLEEALARHTGDGTSSEEMTKTALRLSTAVMMLAVSAHRCVEHDVLASLRERFQVADQNEKDVIVAKSKKRGITGWTVGLGRCLSLSTIHDDNKHKNTGRSLSYQHIRGGHFHTVKHGPGHSLSKVMFFEPTVVRPDLPIMAAI